MTRVIALLLTAITGFAGLAYEVAWQRYLATLLGAHSEATAAVLAIFLGGLSAGYWLFGRLTRALVARARAAGRSPPLLVWYGAVEASIGVYALLFPWLFRAAVGMSGTYDLERLFGFGGDANYYFATPMSFVPNLGGRLLDALRQRFIVLAYGGGRWEHPDDSWRLAGVLGAKGVPNRVDPWGPEWDHDWPTWRAMLPGYLDDLAR